MLYTVRCSQAKTMTQLSAHLWKSFFSPFHYALWIQWMFALQHQDVHKGRVSMTSSFPTPSSICMTYTSKSILIIFCNEKICWIEFVYVLGELTHFHTNSLAWGTTRHRFPSNLAGHCAVAIRYVYSIYPEQTFATKKQSLEQRWCFNFQLEQELHIREKHQLWRTRLLNLGHRVLCSMFMLWEGVGSKLFSES